MSGGSIPYHLRTNKAIDRKIFFDLLSTLRLPKGLKKYKYFSLGGPMLADHQALHYDLGLTKLFSIERDESVLSRQEFNKPFGCIDCLNTSTSEFISNYEETEPVIIWLDYTEPKWGTQFTECQDLMSNLNEYDIFKVTLNANPEVLKGDSGKSPLDKFQDKANCPYLSKNLILNDVQNMRNLPQTLSDMFRRATEEALNVDGLFFQPLMQFRYIDNRHQMLTITGVVLPEDFSGSAFNLPVDNSYFSSGWGEIQQIDVPDVTMKERYEINKYLPLSQEDFDLDLLPFKLDTNSFKAQEKIKNYLRYYRFIPSFQKIMS